MSNDKPEHTPGNCPACAEEYKSRPVKFTVIESQWLRGSKNPDGTRATPSRLLHEGNRCCMGFLARACGVPDGDAEGAFYFSDSRFEGVYDDKFPPELRPLGVTREHGAIAHEIYLVNDDLELDDTKRKAKLMKLFARAGVEVEFVP